MSPQVPDELLAAGEQELLLLLEPEEFLQGVFQLTQVLGGSWVPSLAVMFCQSLPRAEGLERACSGLGPSLFNTQDVVNEIQGASLALDLAADQSRSSLLREETRIRRTLCRAESEARGGETGEMGPGDLGCGLAVQSSCGSQQPSPHLAEGAIGTAQLMFPTECQ